MTEELSTIIKEQKGLPYLIDVFTDDIAIEAGSSPLSCARLICKHYKLPFSFLLVSTPGCAFCTKIAITLDQTIQRVKGNSEGASPFFVYSLVLAKSDPRALEVQTGLCINQFPALFIVDGRGDVIPLIPNYMDEDKLDPMGNGRLTSPDKILQLMARIQKMQDIIQKEITSNHRRCF